MKKETGIEYLMECITDSRNPKIYEIAQQKQMDFMQDFSKWLLSNGWEFDYSTKMWENHENFNQYLFTEVYQMFLESKEA
jgi:hypothetical protein